MIRRSPAEYYIKHLLVHPDAYEDGRIVDILEQFSLDYPSRKYIAGLRYALPRKPPCFNPRNLRHAPTYRFLVKEQIAGLYENTLATETAWDILEKPRAKEFTETMLLGHAPLLAVARRLSDLYGVANCSLEAVAKYRHFFWNMDIVDSVEARATLQLRISRLEHSTDDEDQLQGQALRKASYNDPRKLASELPHSPLSALITQIQMGFAPEKLDLRRVMDTSEMMAQLRLWETLHSTPREFDRRALNLATTARILQEIRQSAIQPEEELRSQLATVALKTDETATPLVHDLTKGQHTVDVAALPIAPKETADEQPAKK